jgi:hypothetical protein
LGWDAISSSTATTPVQTASVIIDDATQALKRAEDVIHSRGYEMKASSTPSVARMGDYWRVVTEVGRKTADGRQHDEVADLMINSTSGEVVRFGAVGTDQSVSAEKRWDYTGTSPTYTSSYSASAWWWLLPLFFGFFGGIISYVALRNEDSESADKMLIFGVVWSFVLFLLTYFYIISKV